jgi:Spherulation-specific family 4
VTGGLDGAAIARLARSNQAAVPGGPDVPADPSNPTTYTPYGLENVKGLSGVLAAAPPYPMVLPCGGDDGANLSAAAGLFGGVTLQSGGAYVLDTSLSLPSGAVISGGPATLTTSGGAVFTVTPSGSAVAASTAASTGGALSAASVAQAPAPSALGNTRQGSIVPLYAYPTYFDSTGDYQTMMAGAPTASIVVLNGNSGPPSPMTADWSNQVTILHAAGMRAVGYVATDYGLGNIATIEAQVALWYSYFPNLDGIFYDEGDYTTGSVPYYTTLYEYVKSLGTGLGMVVLNPGAPPAEGYMACSDILCICENTYTYYVNSYAATQPDWLAYYPASRFYHIIEGVTTTQELAQVLALSRTFNVGWVYAIDTNPGGYTSLTGDATSNPLLWSMQWQWCQQGYVRGPALSVALTSSSTITWQYQYGTYPVAPTGNVTGIILSLPSLTDVPPALDAPLSGHTSMTVINTSSHTVTFAASGTSNVADGTSDVIAALTAATYYWDQAASLWYRST